jgi:hypothetical protein
LSYIPNIVVKSDYQWLIGRKRECVGSTSGWVMSLDAGRPSPAAPAGDQAAFGWRAGALVSADLGAELPTREEALAQLFPGAAFIRETVFLTEAERRDVEEVSGVKMETALVGLYRVRRDGRELARAYVDTHVVRTKKESLLVVIDDKGEVRRIETTAFLEPLEYKAPGARSISGPGWRRPAVNRSIRPLAGAA